MSEPTKPPRIVSVYFREPIALGESPSVSVVNPGGSSNVDSIEAVNEPAPGVLVRKTIINRQKPGAPKESLSCWAPWSNVRSVMYG